MVRKQFAFNASKLLGEDSSVHEEDVLETIGIRLYESKSRMSDWPEDWRLIMSVKNAGDIIKGVGPD